MSNGMKTYITARKADACDQAAEELSQIGSGKCISLPADLSTAVGRNKFVDDLASREDKLDVLVNNAGAAWGAPFEEYPD